MTADGYPGVPEHTCSEIIDFIEQHGTERALSMRLLTPAIRIYKFCTDQGSDWQPVLLAQLQNLGRPTSGTKRLNGHAKDARILKEALALYPESIKDQQAHFCAETKKSRATFYRILARHRETEA
jgi:hypothetical protein